MKRKELKYLLMGIFLVTQAFAGSTFVGNATNSSMRYSDIAPGRVVRWCHDRLAEMDQIRMSAALAKNAGASLEEIVALYEIGLSNLLSEFENISSAYSLTQRSIERGVRYAFVLANRLGPDLGDGQTRLELKLRTRIHFLERYYDFIRVVSEEIDIPYYIPYYNRPGYSMDYCNGRRCNDWTDPGLDEIEFARKTMKYAHEQMSLPVEGFSISSGSRVFPVGSATAFLVLLENIALDVANDLTGSIVSERVTCVTSKLFKLNQDLAVYNAGQTVLFRDNHAWAFSSSLGRIQRIRSELGDVMRDERQYCGRGRRGGW